MPDNLNLTPKRGPSVWTRRHASPDRQAASAVRGIVMLAAGAATAMFGGRMLYRAVKDARSAARDANRATLQLQRRDPVEEESADSFPASDVPSWTAGGATLDARTH